MCKILSQSESVPNNFAKNGLPNDHLNKYNLLPRRGSVHGSRGDLSHEEVGGRHHVRRHREEGACQDLQRH
jgi:hypothetical protein